VFRCERLASCVVPVSGTSLGDSCPDTPKYLEVHYYCREEEHAPLSARPSPPFPDTELTALWNQHGHKVNIDSVLQAVKERPPPDAEDDEAAAGVRVPITTVATVAETAAEDRVTGSPHATVSTATAAMTNVTTRPRIQFVLPSEDTTESSLVSNSTQAGQDRTAEAATGDSEVQAWAANNTSELRSRQEEEEETNNNSVENDEEKEEEEEKDRVDTMFVLEVVTYAVASVCGVIIVFLILKVIHRINYPSSLKFSLELKVLIYLIEYRSVCPLVGIGTPPPLTHGRV